MNPEEALSLGSVSQIVMPQDLRGVIASISCSAYVITSLSLRSGVQREFIKKSTAKLEFHCQMTLFTTG